MRRRTQGTIVLIVLMIIAVGMCCMTIFCGVFAAITGSVFTYLGIDDPFDTTDDYEYWDDDWEDWDDDSSDDDLWEQGGELQLDPTVTPYTEEHDSLNDGDTTVDPIVGDEVDDEIVTDEVIAPFTLEDANETMTLLEEALVPLADNESLAHRLLGIDDIPDTVETPPKDYQIGDVESFWLTDLDTSESFLTETKLAYITDHAYFWIDSSVSYNQSDLKKLAETFENDIYPTNREFFGSEWTPGIDNDEHLYIVYARGLGYSVAGYFSSIDSVHPLAAENSNAHETFMLNADAISFNESFTYGVLAHEFQHMIHWYQDKNETSWLNEGFSELAALLNGYYDSGFDTLYLMDTDLQLNDWPNDGYTTPHYGAAFLFVTYFLDRFGEDATQALVADEQNGMVSVDEVLDQFNATDQLTGEPITADDVFRDWAITNFLDDRSVGDGRFGYSSLESLSRTYDSEYVINCDRDPFQETVHQYGVDYYELNCTGDVTLQFTGDQFVKLLPEGAHLGYFSFWSNKGDQSDMTLTRLFDLTELNAGDEALLQYSLWYDIEVDYDYVYLLTSTDGDRWEFVQTLNGTGSDPVGNNMGWGYNGVTNGWIEETVDLSKFAGQEVYVRFEYVTDAAVNGEGLMLDDVHLDAIGYSTGFETDNGGWEAEGFVRTRNLLPQTFEVSLILFDDYGDATVQYVDLSEDNRTEITVDFDEVSMAVVVISGTTRHTRTEANYTLSFE